MSLQIVETPELAWLRISGADAETFLQGQLSNDVRLLGAAQAQLSSYNSPKGRMLAVLTLLRDGGDILAELHRSVADATLARLKMFVLRAKVTVTAAGDIDAIGLIGREAAATLAALGLPAPEAPLHCATAAGVHVVRRLGDEPRYSLVGAREAIAALRARLPAAVDDGRAWRRADIVAAVPVVMAETRDHFVAQMANLDLHGGISFTKGCYTGQEIVARLHYLGQLKRRMFRARVAGPAPAPGSDVHADGEAAFSGQAVGEIVDAVDDGDGAIASVVLQISARDAALRIGRDGPALTLLDATVPGG